MAENSKIESSRIAEAAYKASLDQLRFMKQQQWVITNYVVLVLASIFAIGRALSGNTTQPLVNLERVLGTILSVVTFAYGFFLLIEIQRDIGKERTRHDKIVCTYVDEADRKNLGLEPYPCPFLRGILFLIALIGVSLVAMGVAIYSLWRS